MEITQDVVDRLLRQIRKESAGCWTYLGGKAGNRSIFWLNGKPLTAKRIVYAIRHQIQINNINLKNICGNQQCCNPEHHEHKMLKHIMGGPPYQFTEGRIAGSKHWRSKLDERQTIDIKLAKVRGEASWAVAARYGISTRHVRYIWAGQRRRARFAPAAKPHAVDSHSSASYPAVDSADIQ